MAKSGLEIIKDITAEVLSKLESLPLKDVLVGVPNAKAGRKDEESGHINNALIGYINEYGAPEMNIPARPHLIPGIRDARDDITEYLEQAGKAALDGRTESVDRALNAAGLVAQTAVKKRITAGIPPELKASTLAARRRRKHKGTTPLIETGQYRNSITYVIRTKKD